MSNVLLIEEAGDVCRLTLNRPEARNALNRELRRRLAAAFNDLRERCRVIVLTGAGPAFCAGFDLTELAGGATGDNAADAGADISRELIPAITSFPGPIIAAVNGPAVTAGFELALACDIILASSEAAFADTHVRVGILPGWGLSQRLPRRIGIHRAKELAFTGNFLDARTACEWGLVNRVVEPDQLRDETDRLVTDILSADPNALVAYKRLIDRGFATNFSDAMEIEAQAALESARALSAGTAGGRKQSVVARGRSQAKKGS